MKPITYIMNNAHVVVLDGEFDAQMVAELRPEFETYSQLDGDVLVDMSGVYFVDSSGVGALVFLFKRLAERGYRLNILSVSGQPADLFNLLHLHQTIMCFDSVKAFLVAQDSSDGGVVVAL